MEGTVRVNVKGHSNKMLSELQRMREDRIQCDLIICVRDDVYYAHKCVLSASSKYFQDIFARSINQVSQDEEINFHDVDSECMDKCLDFIYTGDLEIPYRKIQDLLHIGNKLALDGLLDEVSHILDDMMDAENYYWTRDIAVTYGLGKLVWYCRLFLENHIMDVADQPEFGNTTISELCNIFAGNVCFADSEDEITVLLKWAHKNPLEKEFVLERMEQYLECEFSTSFLRDLLQSNPVVTNDLALYRLISDRLIETLENRNQTTENRHLGVEPCFHRPQLKSESAVKQGHVATPQPTHPRDVPANRRAPENPQSVRPRLQVESAVKQDHAATPQPTHPRDVSTNKRAPENPQPVRPLRARTRRVPYSKMAKGS